MLVGLFRKKLAIAGLLPLLIAVCWSASAPGEEGWTSWRGPNLNGSAASDARPPVKWDATTNIQWATDLPGEGTSTPIVLGDQIFVLSAAATDRKAETPPAAAADSKTIPPDVYYQFIVTCIDRATGNVTWQQTATEEVPHEGHHPTHTYAAGSPTTDGKRLYVSFGSRGIFCYSLSGELLWKQQLGKMHTRFGWGEAVTPVIAGNLLIVNWDQEENSFITALDASTGEPVWKTDRPGEVTSWNTPLVTEFNGRQQVIVNGTERARSYDLKTGKEIWSCGGQTVNAIPSPLRYEDFVVCMSGYRSAAAFAIPLSSEGDITSQSKTLWTWAEGTPYVPSPSLSGRRLYFTANTNSILSCLDVTTGRPISEPKRLSGVGNLYASPLIANGHVYITGRDGTTVVLKDDDSLEVVATNELKDQIDASPIAVGNQLFLRSWKKLYCIADPTATASR
jgi:outer membrane protein assembly factor BamB